MKRILFLGALAALLAFQVPAFGASYTITELGSLGGGGTTARALNDLGMVAGYSQTTGHMTAAFNSLGTSFSSPTAGALSKAYDINNQGVIAGYTSGANGLPTAALFNADGVESMGTLGGAFSCAFAVSDSNTAVGYSLTQSGSVHAFTYSNGGMEDLRTLGGGYSAAFGINDQGVVIGESSTAVGQTHAFYFDDAGVHDLGAFDGGYSTALDLNQNNEIVGYSSLANGDIHAFFTSVSDDALIDLGTFGGEDSYAHAINDLGDIVGRAQTDAGVDHAFIYQDGELLDLNDLLENDGGWDYLLSAYDINIAGQIVGTGIKDGQLCAFLLDPVAVPVPGSGLLLGSILGMFGIGHVMKRKRVSADAMAAAVNQEVP